MESRGEPVACSLSDADAVRQVDEWAELRRLATSRESSDNGAAMTFPVELADRVEDLARREAACCGFLDITTQRSGSTVTVTISSENPDARPAIALLTGS